MCDNVFFNFDRYESSHASSRRAQVGNLEYFIDNVFMSFGVGSRTFVRLQEIKGSNNSWEIVKTREMLEE